MTYAVASNGTIHTTDCPEGRQLRFTNSGLATVEDARRVALYDFSPGLVKVAPCARKADKEAQS